jgi:hypothetical protein
VFEISGCVYRSIVHVLIVSADFINVFFQGVQMSAIPSDFYDVRGIGYHAVCVLYLSYALNNNSNSGYSNDSIAIIRN